MENKQLPAEVQLLEDEPIKEFTGNWKEFVADLRPLLMKYASRHKDSTWLVMRHINSDRLHDVYARMCSRIEDTSETWVGVEYEKALQEIAGELFYPSV